MEVILTELSVRSRMAVTVLPRQHMRPGAQPTRVRSRTQREKTCSELAWRQPRKQLFWVRWLTFSLMTDFSFPLTLKIFHTVHTSYVCGVCGSAGCRRIAAVCLHSGRRWQ
eukprot:Rmarinus@m.9832